MIFLQIQMAWERMTLKDGKKYVVPIGSPYHDKCEDIAITLHSTMDKQFPHLKLWDWKELWDIMIIENEKTKQASALPVNSSSNNMDNVAFRDQVIVIPR